MKQKVGVKLVRRDFSTVRKISVETLIGTTTKIPTQDEITVQNSNKTEKKNFLEAQLLARMV